MPRKTYKMIRLTDIIDFVLSDPKRFPKKLDTIVVSGDFDGNYTHGFHELQSLVGSKHQGTDWPASVCLGYEMHEGDACEWE